jgi:hypothetical protein
MFIVTFILASEHDEGAKATHEPMEVRLPQVRLAIGHIGKVPPRGRLPDKQ